MREWEYFLSFLPDISNKGDANEALSAMNDLEEKFDYFGEKGWELVTIYEGVAYFKRPITMGIYDND